MDPVEDVYTFLSQPENIDIALEIAEYVEKLKGKAHDLFWEAFRLELMRKFSQENIGSTWEYSDKRENETGSWYIRARISQKGYSGKNLSLCFGVVAKDQFYWGVWKHNLSDTEIDNYSIKDLEMVLFERKITHTGPSPKWIAWGDYTKYQIKNREFLHQIFHDKEKLVSEIVNDFWQLFLECKPILEKINQEVNINA
jgi:hypothetical protein